ncbi:MAG: hypothetical protein ACP6IS_08200 [Candidatus Asgardarchaeia archaeon]
MQILSALVILYILNIVYNYSSIIFAYFSADSFNITDALRIVTVDTPQYIAFLNNVGLIFLTFLATLLAILEYKGEKMAAGWQKITFVTITYLVVFGAMGLMSLGISLLIFDFLLLSSTSLVVLRLKDEKIEIFKEGFLHLYSKLSSIITKITFVLIIAWLLAFSFLIIFTEYYGILINALQMVLWAWVFMVIFNSIGYMIIGVTSIIMGQEAS